MVILTVGEPDAAAVQLRRTLEAALASKGVPGTRLVQSIERLIDQGAVTTDFKDLLDYVRGPVAPVPVECGVAGADGDKLVPRWENLAKRA
jgi:hypothetical protein